MSIKSTASFGAQILPAGPNFSVQWVVEADAYDRATVTVAKGQTGKLELQPAADAKDVLLLALVVPLGDYSGNVTYNLGGGVSWPLTRPQIISGSGLMNAVSLGNTITINNTAAGAADVTVDVLVLRTALS